MTLAARRWLRFAAFATVLALALPVHAQQPLLHEFFTPSPDEDVELAATVADGTMSAAIETPNGTVRAPDPNRPRPSSEMTYGGTSTPDSADSSYRIDSNTTRPNVVSYDDPFHPAITPFKRLFAYDTVNAEGELVVRDKDLKPLAVGGAVRDGDDRFYANMTVDLEQDVPVRIPTVGPGARVLAAAASVPNATPERKVRFELLSDGAENWFIRAAERVRVTLVMEIAISRATFGSPFVDVPWSTLAQRAPKLPEPVRRAAEDVLAQIGISQAMLPRTAVASLVGYFRAFKPSSDRPITNGLSLYRDLALSKKGVCRHRAYAFLITALGVGLPARMVRNEAHAWVELYDGTLWHRVDLGGGAERLETQVDPERSAHSPPEDPYSWPEGSESGQQLAERSLSTGSGGSSGGASTPGDAGAPLLGPPTIGPPDVLGDGGVGPDDGRPQTTIRFEVAVRDVRRGAPLRVHGDVEADGVSCSSVRVNVFLRSSSGRLLPVGSLSTDESGRYDGTLVVDPKMEVGEYDVVVTTPGGARCGAARAE